MKKKEQILTKAVDKAIKNGYLLPQNYMRISGIYIGYDEYRIIFSHDFAKAFWGECYSTLDHSFEWEAHLQNMVISKEPLKYIEKFLTK